MCAQAAWVCACVCGEGERKRMGDGNEGANCFQWILKSNLSPQCMGQAARKWNIDDYGENKENDPALWSIRKPQICAGHVSTGNTFPLVFMDPYTLTTALILLRCTNITLYQFARALIYSNDVILIVFTASQQLCNYITIINTHIETNTNW